MLLVAALMEDAQAAKPAVMTGESRFMVWGEPVFSIKRIGGKVPVLRAIVLP